MQIGPRSVHSPWITARADLLEAVSTYAARAAVKLRHEGQAAGGIQVLVSTNPFIPGEPQYPPAALVSFSSPTHDTARLIQAARSGLNRIFKTGFRYKKAGVMLVELVPRTVRQGALFGLEGELHQEQGGCWWRWMRSMGRWAKGRYGSRRRGRGSPGVCGEGT